MCGSEVAKMKRCLIALMTLVMFAGCQARQVTFNLEKDGVLYNYNEMMSLYHPRHWVLTKDELKLSLDIINESEKEALYFDTFDVEASNNQQELMALYEAKLKDLGLEISSVKESTLENGQKCFYVDGTIPKNQAAFCEVVVFSGQKQYIYSYIASTQVYEENQEIMLHYLYSLSVNEAMKTAL